MSAEPRVRMPATAAVLTTATILVCSTLLLAACSSSDTPSAPSLAPTAPRKEAAMLSLSSPAFENGGLIPVEHANTGVAGGENISIPYEWRGAPEGTRSFALALVDRHPVARSWIHWMVSDIPPDVSGLERGASGSSMPPGAVEHENTFGTKGYGGPQPPPGSGKHEYEAIVYALDIASVDANLRTLADFDSAIDGHVLASASCSGLFGR